MQNLLGYSENAASEFFFFKWLNKSSDATIMQPWPETY